MDGDYIIRTSLWDAANEVMPAGAKQKALHNHARLTRVIISGNLAYRLLTSLANFDLLLAALFL